MEGIDSHRSGVVEVICLTDGGKDFPPEVFPGVGAEAIEARLAAAGQATIATNFNAYVLRHAGGIDLVDAGCGAGALPGAGHVAGLLGHLGIAPGDVTRLILTHLHGDHVGGALTAEGELAYPQAEIVMHPAEVERWHGTEGPAGRFLALAERPSLLEDGADLGQGITLWHLPGHTPGHCGLRIGDLALVGDIVHSEALQLPGPDLGPAFDDDAAQAAASRRSALETIVAEGLVWSGSHMLGPRKFARLRVEGDGFARIPL